MKNFTRDEIENYEFGSTLWAGLGNRILVEGVNDNEFWSDVRAAKRGFAKHLDNANNRTAALEEYGRRFGQGAEIVFSRLIDVLSDLMLTFDPRFDVPQDEEPEERQLTGPQKAWSEYRQWSEEHSSSECRARARVDAGYATFVRKNLEREFVAEVGDAVTNLNVRQAPAKRIVPTDVQKFAEDYRTMSSETVKKLLSPGLNPLGPAAAAEANRLFEKACSLGLI